MDVTRFNFVKLLPIIEKQITDCDFISVDCELTGVGFEKIFNYFDTQDERYRKIQKNGMKFAVIQVGLSLFKRNQSDTGNGKSMQCFCYNFYLFNYRVGGSTQNNDRNYILANMSVDFLIQNSFDFNKLFKEGICSMNLEEEKHFLDNLAKKKAEKTAPKNYIEVPKDKKELVESALQRYLEWVDDPNQEKLEFEPANGFVNALIRQAIEKDQLERKQKAALKKNKKKMKTMEEMEIIVTRNYDKDSGTRNIILLKIPRSLYEQNENTMITESIGFSKVIDIIVKSKKPLIGHNVLLDIMHIIDKFIIPIPNEYERFREMLRDLFPVIYDTKYLMSYFYPSFGNQNINLNTLYEFLKKQTGNLFGEVQICLNSNDDTDEIIRTNLSDFFKENSHLIKLHDAAYDSLITGLVFYAFMTKFENDFPNKSIWKESCIRNRIYNSFSYDISYLSSEQDLPIPRENVFYVKFHYDPENFSKFFSQVGAINVSKLGDDDALIAVENQEIAKKVFDYYKTCEHYLIITYAEYQSKKEAIARKFINDVIDSASPNKQKKETIKSTSVLLKKQPKKNKSKQDEMNSDGFKLIGTKRESITEVLLSKRPKMMKSPSNEKTKNPIVKKSPPVEKNAETNEKIFTETDEW